MKVEVVGAGKADAKLGKTQSTVVASFFGANIAYIGYRKAHLVAPVGRSIVGGAVIVVEQVERHGEFVAAINAHACRIDVAKALAVPW